MVNKTEMSYVIRLYNGRRSTFKIKNHLQANGFIYIKKSNLIKYWEKQTTDSKEVAQWRLCAKKNGLSFECKDSRYERNNTYRSDFFRAYTPFYKGRYFCVYCGKLLKPERLEIDHIISVHAAANTMVGKRMLKRKKIENVNDVRNLGASCFKCNRKKGSQLYGWVFRGYLGKSNKYQVFRGIVRIIIFCCIIIFCLHISYIV